MKPMTGTWVLLTLLMLAAPTGVGAEERTVTLELSNFSCPSCAYIVKRTLSALPGVRTSDVSYAEKTAKVRFEDTETSVAALRAATAGLGFPAQVVR